jgi:hypothetical protein
MLSCPFNSLLGFWDVVQQSCFVKFLIFSWPSGLTIELQQTYNVLSEIKSGEQGMFIIFFFFFQRVDLNTTG